MYRTTFPTTHPVSRRQSDSRTTPDRTLATLGLLVFLTVLAAPAAARPCHDAPPLPLDHSISGEGTLSPPARYSLEIAGPGLLIVEARSTQPHIATRVRLLDAQGRNVPGDPALPRIAGRQVRRMSRPGSYCVEVQLVADAILVQGGFRLDAWILEESVLPASGQSTAVLKTTETGDADDDEPPHEPLDEWDELLGGNTLWKSAESGDEDDDEPPHEPLDEWDELQAPGNDWREINGYGFLELDRASADRPVRFHPTCPWVRRPDLLVTFTCARPVRFTASGEQSIDRLLSERPEMFILHWANEGRLRLASPGQHATLFDAHGSNVAELFAGDSIVLASGTYYLRAEASPGADVIQLITDLF